MICNCAEEIDLNSFRWLSFISNLLNLNGNFESATVRRGGKSLGLQLNVAKYPVILSRAHSNFREMQRIWDYSVPLAFT